MRQDRKQGISFPAFIEFFFDSTDRQITFLFHNKTNTNIILVPNSRHAVEEMGTAPERERAHPQHIRGINNKRENCHHDRHLRYVQILSTNVNINRGQYLHNQNILALCVTLNIFELKMFSFKLKTKLHTINKTYY